MRLAARLYQAVPAEALLVLVDRPVDWEQLKKTAGSAINILVVADTEEQLRGAEDAESGNASCSTCPTRRFTTS